MIYRQYDVSERLSQGDIFDECPVLTWKTGESEPYTSAVVQARVIVLTQACDVPNMKTDRITVAIVHNANKLAEAGALKSQTIRDQIRKHQVYGWYFLPSGPGLEE